MSTIVVRSNNITEPPLLETAMASSVVINDSNGEPMVILVKLAEPDVWGMGSRGDPDWQALLVRQGLAKPGKIQI